ncbi:hypothetical protein [Riemerella columbina]|uniref:hypothetical protein n=1 Tax=Riemerella columbina TaxID=103810 RepID=UPI0003A4BCDB|nr:hypothetical protein [Riemerella columbina]
MAFLAMGCSPVLIFFKLCVIYLGAGRFFYALSRKPKAVGKSTELRDENLEISFLSVSYSPLKTY